MALYPSHSLGLKNARVACAGASILCTLRIYTEKEEAKFFKRNFQLVSFYWESIQHFGLKFIVLRISKKKEYIHRQKLISLFIHRNIFYSAGISKTMVSCVLLCKYTVRNLRNFSALWKNFKNGTEGLNETLISGYILG
jgi:hypothetical protein